MTLELFEVDLKSESKNKPTSMVKFTDLTMEAQAAVRIVGKATFYRNKGTRLENYCAVYPNQ